MNIIFRLAIAILLVLTITGTAAMDIENTHSGSWYNTNQSGHGFNVEVLDDQTMVIYWHVYNPDGTPTFLVTVAEIDGDIASGIARTYSGMKFGEFDPQALKEEIWGTMSVQFTDCNTAQVHYDSDLSHDGVPFCSGTISVTRLTGVQGLDCRQQQSIAEYGNYTAAIPQIGGSVDANFMIFKDGTISYSSAWNPGVYDFGLGLGQLTMNGETTFDFELLVSEHLAGDTFSFEGKGDFSNGLTLDLPMHPESSVFPQLHGQFDPATLDGIRLDQLTGTFSGSGPDAMLNVRLEIAEDGYVIGRALLDCPLAGKIIIPDTGMNQFKFNAELGGACGGSWTSVGRIDGERIYLMTRWEYEWGNGLWELFLTEE